MYYSVIARNGSGKDSYEESVVWPPKPLTKAEAIRTQDTASRTYAYQGCKIVIKEMPTEGLAAAKALLKLYRVTWYCDKLKSGGHSLKPDLGLEMLSAPFQKQLHKRLAKLATKTVVTNSTETRYYFT